MAAYVYILRCADGSYYVGSTRRSLEARVAEHQAGVLGDYTAMRRPVTLMYHEAFERIDDCMAAERRLKGWSRAKKEALINGDISTLKRLSTRRGGRPRVENGVAESPRKTSGLSNAPDR